MSKVWKYAAAAALVIATAGVAWHFIARQGNGDEDIEVFKARPGVIKEMARLCSMDIYNEVPVLDTVNSKVIFAVQKQSGSISFDLDGLSVDDSGDTVRAVLPREIVDVYESTEKNSWQVIDTKVIGPMAILRSPKMSVTEENMVKRKAKGKAIARLYRNGTVRKARKEGAENMRRLLELAYRKPVVVTDSTPGGTPPSSPKRTKI